MVNASPMPCFACPTIDVGTPFSADDIELANRDDISDPSTATPMAPPICRVVSLTAEPTPAFALGNEPMIESVAGAMTLLMPTDSSAATTITCRVLEFTSSVRKPSRHKAMKNNPPATTTLLPNFRTQMLDIGARIIISADCGSSTAPAFTVEYPSTSWKY